MTNSWVVGGGVGWLVVGGGGGVGWDGGGGGVVGLPRLTRRPGGRLVENRSTMLRSDNEDASDYST